MKPLILFFFLCLCMVSEAQKLETFSLKNGETITGEVLDDDNGKLIVRVNNKIVTIDKSDLNSKTIVPDYSKSDTTKKINNDLNYKSLNKKTLTIGGTIGFASENFLSVDIHVAGQNGWGTAFGVAVCMQDGTKGEKYTVINWNEYPQDYVSTGSYYTTFNIGLAKYTTHFYVAGLLGYAAKTAYQNRYDNYHILGNDGAYYIEKKDGGALNYGGQAGFLMNGFMMGLTYTKYSGVGFAIGLYF